LLGEDFCRIVPVYVFASSLASACVRAAASASVAASVSPYECLGISVVGAVAAAGG